MRTATVTMVTVLLGALAGCGEAGRADGGLRPVAGPETYVVTGVTVAGVRRDLVPGTEIRLRFEHGRLTLTAGCNTMTGRYRLDGSRMTVGALATTEMGCDRARMAQDTWVGGLFARPVQFTPQPDGAVISGDTVLSLADREDVSPDAPLVGTQWLLDTVYDGGAASSVPAGGLGWVVFGEGEVRTYDGCNGGGRGLVEVSEGTIIFGTHVHTTAVLCPQPEVEQVRTALAKVLGGTATYRIEEKSLTITNGRRGLGFHAVDKLPPIR